MHIFGKDKQNWQTISQIHQDKRKKAEINKIKNLKKERIYSRHSRNTTNPKTLLHAIIFQ